MSSVYNLEPPTHGRVTLHTTHGPLDVRLWSSHTPHTCRNFVQHCLNGYYDGLAFHRIVPNLLVQTGDRSGTGHGGHVALPEKAGIPREIVGRLKFRKRGLVGMVADDAGLAKSQFFITLAKADWLNGQHTIFAQIVGDTIYNVLNIAATGERNQVDDDAPRIKSVTVDVNPFPELKAAGNDQAATQPAKREPVTKPVRNKRLLSFANDSDTDSDDSAPTRMLKPAETKRRIRRNSDSTLFLCKPDSQPASEINPELSTSTVADRKRKHPESDQADVVRKANEEFERLKAELEGLDEKDKEEHQSQPAKEEDGKEDDTEAMCRALAEVTTEDERDERRRRKRRRKDEGDTLRRLKAFEGKVVQARRMGDSADDGKMWYAKRLNLATMAGDDDEYEVRMPKPKRGSMKLRRG
eukprot:TRINITY_DN34_c0_g1_i1.p1 TRINITY_DN34_c0_g1~~TRINITY_DN34_c0_g1_i1.p1  ORF type:complete len:411 (+),score=61.82 TRINITY_DN34_c0_g1_i1:2529-3761(+)